MTVVDLWVNVLSEETVQRWTSSRDNAGITGLLGGDLTAVTSPELLIAEMDRNGVDVGVLAAALTDPSQALQHAEQSGGRLVVAVVVDRPDRPVKVAAKLRDALQHPLVRMVRLTPLTTQIPIDGAAHYPVYVSAAEAGVPVSVNVGIPGPRVRSACMDPRLLESVLIDIPEVTIIGAHMGHPYEELLRTYMDKWSQLFLSCTAFSPRRMDPGLLSWMDSSRGRGRVLWGSDHPYFPQARSIAEARALGLGPDAQAAFLGDAAARLLGLAGG
jgi:predicted TIM-barrel fold metal-dependent hydrolase